MAFTRKPAQATEAGPRPPIALIRVKSEQLASLGYDATSQTMAAQFLPKEVGPAAVYHYPGITPEAFEEARKPETTGSQFRAIIKGLAFLKYAPEPIPEALA